MPAGFHSRQHSNGWSLHGYRAAPRATQKLALAAKQFLFHRVPARQEATRRSTPMVQADDSRLREHDADIAPTDASSYHRARLRPGHLPAKTESAGRVRWHNVVQY